MAMLLFGTKPAVISVAAKADTNKRVANKVIPETLFFRNSNGPRIAPPSTPVQAMDWWKVRRDPLDLRSGSLVFPLLSMYDEGCPGDSCSTSCAGSLTCPDPGAFLQLLSPCQARCCWCGNPGSCSDLSSCNYLPD